MSAQNKGNKGLLKQNIKDFLSKYKGAGRALLVLLGLSLGAAVTVAFVFFQFPATITTFSTTLGLSGTAALALPLSLLGLVGGFSGLSALLSLLEITCASPRVNAHFNRNLHVLSLAVVPPALVVFLTAAVPSFLKLVSVHGIFGGAIIPIAMAGIFCAIPGVIVFSYYDLLDKLSWEVKKESSVDK